MRLPKKWVVVLAAIVVAALVVGLTWCSFWHGAGGRGAAAPRGQYFEEKALFVRDGDGGVLWEGTLRRFRLRPYNPRSHGFVFSPDLTRFAYASGDVYGGHMDRVIIDGKESRKYDEVGEIIFSPDSRRVAYDATKRDKHFLVLDGQKGPLYDDEILTIVFSPDSRRIAHTAGREYKDVVVLDGKVVGSHYYVDPYSLVFSPDSRHFAYYAWDDAKAVYLDGKKLESFDEYAAWSLAFSPDSRRITYGFRRGKQWFLRFAQKQYGPYDKVDGIRRQISPDSTQIAFPAMRGKNWFLICGEREYGPSPWPPSPVFSPAGQPFAYVISFEGNSAVFLGGKLLGRFDRLGQAEFSPDGKHFAFVGDKGENSLLIVDGRTVKQADWVEFKYSPDGKRLAAVVGEGDKGYLYLDGREGKRYQRIWNPGPGFSPDSRHVAYWAVEGDRAVLVIDGMEALDFHQASPAELLFCDDNRLRGVIFVGTSLENAWVGLLELTPRRRGKQKPDLSSVLPRGDCRALLPAIG